MIRLCLALIISLLSQSVRCEQLSIVIGDGMGPVEYNAAETLREDLLKVVPEAEVHVQPALIQKHARQIQTLVFVGTVDSPPPMDCLETIEGLLPFPELPAETFLVRSIPEDCNSQRQSVLILGGDPLGLQYGVAYFSETVLGIDPLAYWTGTRPPVRSHLDLTGIDHQAAAPRFALRGYFDNDNDMLANFKGRKLIVELDLWREMIDSLVRLRYNYIDIHDLLGRPEYYLRDYYLEMTDYRTDLDLVDAVIDYAHLKGLKVQIPMYLGWEFKHIDMDQVCLGEFHDTWMETYQYYLDETPLGKADLFLARPRHPIYDWAYRCPGEDATGVRPGPLMTRMFNDLLARIHARNSDAILVCDLWMEGREMWATGQFAPDSAIQMLWADHGFADFQEWPEEFKGYPFGVYIHAGVWKNQVVQDPYPGLIRDALLEAHQRGLSQNVLVNGQSFKPFLLNLEASARAAWDPQHFDPEAFYLEWSSRTFGSSAAPMAVASFKALHEAHQGVLGFREITKNIRRTLRRLNEELPQREERLAVEKALPYARQAVQKAEAAAQVASSTHRRTLNDQLLFPARIYRDNLALYHAVLLWHEALSAYRSTADPESLKSARSHGKDALGQLQDLIDLLRSGSGWSKWEHWYDPENFRIHTPPPTVDELKAALAVTR
jgi:hypothetical protein